MNFFLRRQQPLSPPSPGADALERVRLLVAGERAADGSALEELTAALLEVGSTGSAEDSFEALRTLTERPVLLLRLDAFIRREWWHPTRPTPRPVEADPVALALAAS
ncbi:hypothetical protein, partial [Streptomyces sp. MJM8645]